MSRRGLALLGLMNLAVAGGLYCATWWWADPELRIKLILHTPLPGVDLDATAGVFVPPQSQSSHTQPVNGVSQAPGAASAVEGQTAQAVLFVATIIGWEILATIAACALSLSAGALLRRAGGPVVRRGGLILGLLMLIALGWTAYSLWTEYERFTPHHLRYAMAALVVVSALLGLVIRRDEKRLTHLAAIALIVSAAGSALGLYIGAHYDAFESEQLFLPFVVFLAVVFVVHSSWGWVLLPLASRISRQ